MIILMIGIVITGSVLDWYGSKKDMPPGGWREQVTQDSERLNKLLSDPKLDEGTKIHVQDRIAINNYRLEHDIQTDNGTMWDGINDCADLIILITLFTVIVAGDSLAGEFSSGTIKLLLIRPASRLKILLSKYISMLLFGILLLIILFAVSVLVNGLIYKFDHINLPLLDINAAGQVVELNMVANLWKTYALNAVSTIMFVTIAFMISSAFRSSALAIGLCIFSLFGGAILSEILQPYSWSKYILFPNLNLGQYLTGRPYQDDMTLTFSIVLLAIYFVVFNLVSWQVFTRRDVAS